MSGSNQVKDLTEKSDKDSLLSDKDHISNLPKDVTSEILSHLSSKEAVVTCVLSKKWKYNWTFIDNLIISDKLHQLQPDSEETVVFVNFVERALVLVQNVTSIELEILCKLNSDVLKSWMVSLSRQKVEKLDLYVRQDFGFSCSLLNVTKLRNMVLSLPSFVVSSMNRFPVLASLHLRDVKVKKEGTGTDETVIFTFPVLETLRLKNCTWCDVKLVEIHAPALAKFSSQTTRFLQFDHYSISIHSTRPVQFVTTRGLQENFLLNGTTVVNAVMDNSVFMETEALLMSAVKLSSLLRQLRSSLKYLKLSPILVQAMWESGQGYLS